MWKHPKQCFLWLTPVRDTVAYGGKENEAQVYCVETGKVIWTAKNVGNNFLDLREPVWVTDLAFLPEEDQRKLAICTAYGQVRLYDIRAQRRPVIDSRVTEVSGQVRLHDGVRLTSISISPTTPTWYCARNLLLSILSFCHQSIHSRDHHQPSYISKIS